MLLSDILKELDTRIITGDPSCDVTSVEFDSRRVKAGSVFVCIKGFTVDGHSFAGSAASSGAACVIVDADREGFDDDMLIDAVKDTGCVIVETRDTKKALAVTAAALQGHPERELDVYGITGTKGKTTSTFLLRAIFEAAGKKSGLVGTVCNIICGEKIPAKHTTPESSEIFGMMHSLKENGGDSLVMEVSSQGLKLDRVYGIKYRAAAFTNLYEDHIAPEEHPDMDDYFSCKLKIFDNCTTAIVNADCEQASKVCEYASSRCKVLTYGIDSDADFKAEDLTLERRDHVTGTKFTLRSSYISGEFFVALPGRFNVSNALCAIAMACCAGCDEESIRKALATASVPGRLQPVENKLGLNILVDYAHNAAALENVLLTLKKYTEGKVITVFGCGGDRSVTRRFEMGEVSGDLSDKTIITSDNPRSEDPMAIIANIINGIGKTNGKFEVYADRASAIRHAIKTAEPGDTVLIAGKGHEDYQIFKDKTIHFDDVEQAEKAVAEIENGSKPMFSLEEIKRAVGGRTVYKTEERIYATFVQVYGISSNSKEINKGDVFIALRGERFNGGEYTEEAIANGACAVVVDNAEYVPEGAVGIVVEDTTKALCDLAAYYRFKLDAKVVAVTGSVGKTSTRQLIAEVLGLGFRVHSTKANNNNEIGMSKTILSAPLDTQILVVEMGMRGLEEISKLTMIARPDIAIITNVGYSHIGRLGSRDNIMRAKMEITEGLTDGGILIVNGDDPMLFEYARRILSFNNLIAAVSSAVFPVEGCPECINSYEVDENDDGSVFRAHITRLGEPIEFGDPFRIKMFGNAGIRNALFALLCAHICEIGMTDGMISAIRETLFATKAMDGRGAITETKKYMIVNDAYNAAPESMENSFLNFSKRAKGRRKVLALGNMMELGAYAPQLHEMTGKACARYGFDKVFITGENSEDFIRGAHMVDIGLEISRCRDADDVSVRLADYLRDGDAILFKASHSFGFEKLAKDFIEKGDS
ncbi:MAG: UDP-N-acetylmuramoyl-L-alanyl-D-glutamate--2,6-diaminopimelate ligase [Saccharofermentans sp.]|nr:UDP-N-acetylmuramoyl-L-alanyl-D-glutamate--2,6-diaminopimelate ligase [Saccharofermentans sp.]